MRSRKQPRRPVEQFLGEIETEIVGLQYYGGTVTPGEHVNLEREPENQYAPSLIRVENGFFQTTGYIDRHTSSWLAPLIDSGQVRVEGYIPAGEVTAGDGPVSQRLALMVFLSTKGESILTSGPIETRMDALHAVAVWVYHDARSLTSPELIAGLAEGLEPLLHQDLLPKSKLLLSLIPSIARELRAAQGMQALVTLKTALDPLVIGPPLEYEGVTLFPLSWPQPQEPICALLSRAIKSGTAQIEEVRQAGRLPQLRVHNKSLRPLLIPEGDIIVSTNQNRVVSPILLAAKTSFTLPPSSVEQGRWQSGLGEETGNHEASRRHANSWEQSEDADAELPLPDAAAGVAIGRNGKLLLLDLFDAAPTLAHFWPRLSQACVPYRALEKQSRPVLPEQVRQVLRDIVDHARPSRTVVGAGAALEIVNNGLAGSVVLYADRVCHLNAFIKTP